MHMTLSLLTLLSVKANKDLEQLWFEHSPVPEGSAGFWMCVPALAPLLHLPRSWAYSPCGASCPHRAAVASHRPVLGILIFPLHTLR